MSKERKWITILDATVVEGRDRFPGETLEVGPGTYQTLVQALGKAQPASREEILAVKRAQLAEVEAEPEEEAPETDEAEAESFLEMLSPKAVKALQKASVTEASEVLELGLEGLQELKGVGPALAEEILESAVAWTADDEEEPDEEEDEED